MENKDSLRVIFHALLVFFVGLIGGVLLVFSLLDAVHLWPLPAWDVSVGGSTRGWQAAHVGGMMNGIMMIIFALLMAKLPLTQGQTRFCSWSLVITGWGNTIFYWAGNFAPNRGLSVGDTPFGPGDLMGALSFLGGGAAMFLTFALVILLIKACYQLLQEAQD